MSKDAEYINKKINVDYAIEISQWIMKFVGIWPDFNKLTLLEAIIKKLQNVACYFLFLFVLVPGILHMMMREQNPRKRLKMIGPLLNCVMGIIKYSFFLSQSNRIRDCLTHVREDWNKVNSSDRDIMINQSILGRKLAVTFNFFMYSSGVYFRIITPMIRKNMNKSQQIAIRPLPCPSYFVILDEKVSPFYEIILILQIISGFTVYSVTCSLCSIASTLITHACGQLKILVKRMRELIEVCNDGTDIVDEKLFLIVEHQIRVRRFLKNAETGLQNMFLVEIGGCCLHICLLFYYILMEWQNKDTFGLFCYILMIISFTYCMFLLCYIGELLSNQSNEVGMTSCTIDWYRLPAKQARNLILIIAVSTAPLKISAGKLIGMSLNSFGEILKTSVAYFNILRRMVV